MKIGIITLYYKNNNYGGVAQAYALNKYIESLGYESELITYQKEKSNLKLVVKNKSVNVLIHKIFVKVKRKLVKPIEKMLGKKFKEKLKCRANKLEEFRNKMPHSKVYTLKNIEEIKDKYDVFMTGSDQSWNPGVIDQAFTFECLNECEKNIMSYASSVAVTNVSEQYLEFMKKELKKYKYISVREEQSKDILKNVTDQEIYWVADPTLILEKKQWKNMLSEDKMLKEKYIFSYMIGDSISQRNKIKRFAKKKGLKLVTVPFIKGGNKFEYRIEDNKFGDIQMLDITFEQFLKLIRDAEYVITDSFHAVCFSYVFEKEFYVFEKKTSVSTSSRLYSLLNEFKLVDRIVKDDIIEKNEKIDYLNVNKNIESWLEESRNYLNGALKSFEK